MKACYAIILEYSRRNVICPLDDDEANMTQNHTTLNGRTLITTSLELHRRAQYIVLSPYFQSKLYSSLSR